MSFPVARHAYREVARFSVVDRSGLLHEVVERQRFSTYFDRGTRHALVAKPGDQSHYYLTESWDEVIRTGQNTFRSVDSLRGFRRNTLVA